MNAVSAQANSGIQNQYRAGYGNYDSKNDRNAQGQSRYGDQPKTQQQTSGYGQNSFDDGRNSRNLDPLNSPKATKSPEVASPELDRFGSDKQNESKGRQSDFEIETDLNSKSDLNKPSKILNEVNKPKF